MTSAYGFTGLRDYLLPQRVVIIPAGVTRVALNISLTDNQDSEVDKFFDLFILPRPLIDYDLLRGRLDTARITVVDDDHG